MEKLSKAYDETQPQAEASDSPKATPEPPERKRVKLVLCLDNIRGQSRTEESFIYCRNYQLKNKFFRLSTYCRKFIV